MPAGRRTVLAVAALAAAGACAVGGALRWQDDRTPTVAVEALSVTPPSTVSLLGSAREDPSPPTSGSEPSRPAPTPTAAGEAVESVESSPPTSVGLPVSPLAEQVGDPVSLIPVAPPVDVVPTAIAIDAIGLAGVPVRPVGVAADGQLEIPDETEVGWYTLGAAPGQPGATVLAAHVSWRGSDGPFRRLAELVPGARVEVALADMSVRTYEVVRRDQYGKLMLPADEIWRTAGPESLVLITCGGEFDADRRRYLDNVVVTAVPVAMDVPSGDTGAG